MDTSRKTEISTIVEGAAAEVESAGTEPCISASEKIVHSGKENIDQGAEVSTQEASPTRSPKSCGPRTAKGKQKSKHNALKHGVFSQVVLLNGEPRVEFDSLLSGLWNRLEPEGTLEELLVDKLAALVWRHRRLIIAVGERMGTEFFGWYNNIGGALPLDLLLRYESNLERAFDRTLNQLERLQRIRNGQPVPPTLNVNVST